MGQVKRYLFLIHRWLGVVLAILMVAWFGSGVTMMYVGFPNQTDAERLANLAPLGGEDCCISLAQAATALTQTQTPTGIILRRVGGVPTYSFAFGKRSVEVDAVTGAVLTPTEDSARRAAEEYFRTTIAEKRGLVEDDTWTHGGAINPHRPLYRFLMNDADNTLAYVSSMNGEVVRTATETQRIWNYVGAWLHWLHMFRTSHNHDVWAQIIIWSSAACIALTLTGAVIGIMRWRFKGRHKSGSKSPYRDGYMRYHHIAGLLFTIITTTWLISGLLSVDPGKIFTKNPVVLDMPAYRGAPLAAEQFNIEARDVMADLGPDFGVREIEWRLVDGAAYLVARNNRGMQHVRAAGGPELSHEAIMRAGERLVAGAKMVKSERIEKYDYYYYMPLRHGLFGETERPLPVTKLTFDDPLGTWVYLDDRTGAVIQTYNDNTRNERFWFILLHDLDWHVLLESRPSWDILVIVLSIGGLVISATGVVIGYRRLKLKLS